MLQGLTNKEKDEFYINAVFIEDFLFGSSKQGDIKNHIYRDFDLPMNIHFWIKVIINNYII